MISRSLLPLALVLLLSPAQTYAQPSTPAAAHGQVAALSAAAGQLLQLLDQRVNDDAVELGEHLVREHPEDAAVHALYAISLFDSRMQVEALRLSDENVARWPEDPWVQVAHGYMLRDVPRREEALAAAARARQLVPGDADIARHVMSIYSVHNRRDQAVALADSFIFSGRATAGLRVAKASTLWDMADYAGIRDTAAATLAQREIERALAETPPSAAAHLAAGDRLLRDRRADEALPLLKRAVELSPHSSTIRQAYWRGISAQAGMPADDRRALIDADMEAWLDAGQHAVGVRYAVAEHFLRAGDFEGFESMANLIQQEHAGTWQAANVASRQAWVVANAAYEQASTRADSITATSQVRDALWAITRMPGANSDVLATTYGQLFRLLERDSTTTADELLSVFERLEEHSFWPSASTRHVVLPVALAERGSHLDYAEQLARVGLEPMEDDLEAIRDWWTVADYATMLDRVNSQHHAAVGWVLFHKGNLAEAKRELEKAHEALNTSATPTYRLGRIAEAEGNLEAAEIWYATILSPRSRVALERLYLTRNESLDGFDAYLVAINERDIARRRALIESQRIADPMPLPAFEHEWMNGGRFSSEALEGKVAVIYFWGVWCGPCVRSAPETQAFAEKFRDHPDVVFLTVANDDDPDTTRDFMKEKGYDFPVIFDEGLVRMANIFAFPTTLFVDRDGRIVFSYISSSPRVVEEYTWRVESLLGQTVAEGENVYGAR